MLSHIKFTPDQLYFGYPVFLVSTIDLINGVRDITPLSSSILLKDTMIIGVLKRSKCYENIKSGSDVTINIPDASLWGKIEKITKYTGSENNHGKIKTNSKLEIAGFNNDESSKIKPYRINECPLQIETKVLDLIDMGFFLWSS